MSLVKKLKDILFEEEEYTEPIKVVEEEKKEEVPSRPIKIEREIEEVKEPVREEIPSERELFKSENNFRFPDFDEEEFTSSISNNVPKTKPTPNVLEYERKKTFEKRTDYGRYERIETREYTEKKKFKPSPIISPVYGILNQDYKAEDIVNKKDSSSNIDIEEVRKKAFEPKVENVEIIDEPVVTFFEEKETVKLKEMPKREEYKSINDLLEKLEVEPKNTHKDLDDTLDNDLYELIDSMYDEREED